MPLSTIGKQLARRALRWLAWNTEPHLTLTDAETVAYWHERYGQRIQIDPTAMVNETALAPFPNWNGTLRVGQQSTLRAKVILYQPQSSLIIGDRSQINKSTFDLTGVCIIGDDVLIADSCHIADHDAHSTKWSERQHDAVRWLTLDKDWSVVPQMPVTIHDKAWIAYGCIILKGVTIGEGAIVGAGSVVTAPVSPWTLVAGVPARTIRSVSEADHP